MPQLSTVDEVIAFLVDQKKVETNSNDHFDEEDNNNNNSSSLYPTALLQDLINKASSKTSLETIWSSLVVEPILGKNDESSRQILDHAQYVLALSFLANQTEEQQQKQSSSHLYSSFLASLAFACRKRFLPSYFMDTWLTSISCQQLFEAFDASDSFDNFLSKITKDDKKTMKEKDATNLTSSLKKIGETLLSTADFSSSELHLMKIASAKQNDEMMMTSSIVRVDDASKQIFAEQLLKLLGAKSSSDPKIFIDSIISLTNFIMKSIIRCQASSVSSLLLRRTFSLILPTVVTFFGTKQKELSPNNEQQLHKKIAMFCCRSIFCTLIPINFWKDHSSSPLRSISIAYTLLRSLTSSTSSVSLDIQTLKQLQNVVAITTASPSSSSNYSCLSVSIAILSAFVFSSSAKALLLDRALLKNNLKYLPDMSSRIAVMQTLEKIPELTKNSSCENILADILDVELEAKASAEATAALEVFTAVTREICKINNNSNNNKNVNDAHSLLIQHLRQNENAFFSTTSTIAIQSALASLTSAKDAVESKKTGKKQPIATNVAGADGLKKLPSENYIVQIQPNPAIAALQLAQLLAQKFGSEIAESILSISKSRSETSTSENFDPLQHFRLARSSAQVPNSSLRSDWSWTFERNNKVPRSKLSSSNNHPMNFAHFPLSLKALAYQLFCASFFCVPPSKGYPYICFEAHKKVDPWYAVGNYWPAQQQQSKNNNSKKDAGGAGSNNTAAAASSSAAPDSGEAWKNSQFVTRGLAQTAITSGQVDPFATYPFSTDKRGALLHLYLMNMNPAAFARGERRMNAFLAYYSLAKLHGFIPPWFNISTCVLEARRMLLQERSGKTVTIPLIAAARVNHGYHDAHLTCRYLFSNIVEHSRLSLPLEATLGVKKVFENVLVPEMSFGPATCMERSFLFAASEKSRFQGSSGRDNNNNINTNSSSESNNNDNTTAGSSSNLNASTLLSTSSSYCSWPANYTDNLFDVPSQGGVILPPLPLEQIKSRFNGSQTSQFFDLDNRDPNTTTKNCLMSLMRIFVRPPKSGTAYHQFSSDLSLSEQVRNTSPTVMRKIKPTTCQLIMTNESNLSHTHSSLANEETLVLTERAFRHRMNGNDESSKNIAGKMPPGSSASTNPTFVDTEGDEHIKFRTKQNCLVLNFDDLWKNVLEVAEEQSTSLRHVLQQHCYTVLEIFSETYEILCRDNTHPLFREALLIRLIVVVSTQVKELVKSFSSSSSSSSSYCSSSPVLAQILGATVYWRCPQHLALWFSVFNADHPKMSEALRNINKAIASSDSLCDVRPQSQQLPIALMFLSPVSMLESSEMSDAHKRAIFAGGNLGTNNNNNNNNSSTSISSIPFLPPTHVHLTTQVLFKMILVNDTNTLMKHSGVGKFLSKLSSNPIKFGLKLSKEDIEDFLLNVDFHGQTTFRDEDERSAFHSLVEDASKQADRLFSDLKQLTSHDMYSQSLTSIIGSMSPIKNFQGVIADFGLIGPYFGTSPLTLSSSSSSRFPRTPRGRLFSSAADFGLLNTINFPYFHYIGLELRSIDHSWLEDSPRYCENRFFNGRGICGSAYTKNDAMYERPPISDNATPNWVFPPGEAETYCNFGKSNRVHTITEARPLLNEFVRNGVETKIHESHALWDWGSFNEIFMRQAISMHPIGERAGHSDEIKMWEYLTNDHANYPDPNKLYFRAVSIAMLRNFQKFGDAIELLTIAIRLCRPPPFHFVLLRAVISFQGGRFAQCLSDLFYLMEQRTEETEIHRLKETTLFRTMFNFSNLMLDTEKNNDGYPENLRREGVAVHRCQILLPRGDRHYTPKQLRSFMAAKIFYTADSITSGDATLNHSRHHNAAAVLVDAFLLAWYESNGRNTALSGSSWSAFHSFCFQAITSLTERGLLYDEYFSQTGPPQTWYREFARFIRDPSLCSPEAIASRWSMSIQPLNFLRLTYKYIIYDNPEIYCLENKLPASPPRAYRAKSDWESNEGDCLTQTGVSVGQRDNFIRVSFMKDLIKQTCPKKLEIVADCISEEEKKKIEQKNAAHDGTEVPDHLRYPEERGIMNGFLFTHNKEEADREDSLTAEQLKYIEEENPNFIGTYKKKDLADSEKAQMKHAQRERARTINLELLHHLFSEMNCHPLTCGLSRVPSESVSEQIEYLLTYFAGLYHSKVDHPNEEIKLKLWICALVYLLRGNICSYLHPEARRGVLTGIGTCIRWRSIEHAEWYFDYASEPLDLLLVNIVSSFRHALKGSGDAANKPTSAMGTQLYIVFFGMTVWLKPFCERVLTIDTHSAADRFDIEAIRQKELFFAYEDTLAQAETMTEKDEERLESKSPTIRFFKSETHQSDFSSVAQTFVRLKGTFYMKEFLRYIMEDPLEFGLTTVAVEFMRKFDLTEKVLNDSFAKSLLKHACDLLEKEEERKKKLLKTAGGGTDDTTQKMIEAATLLSSKSSAPVLLAEMEKSLSWHRKRIKLECAQQILKDAVDEKTIKTATDEINKLQEELAKENNNNNNDNNNDNSDNNKK